MGRGKFPGMGNMGGMMKQVQQAQKKIEKMQKELEAKELEVSVGGGAVTVKANGNKEIIAIDIDESVVDPEDVEMLEDLILAGVNEVLRNVEEMTSKEMSKLTGGLNIPGM